MSILTVNSWVSYRDIKNLLEVTDGNLASHIQALEKISFLEIKKQFIGKKPLTTYKVTKTGRKAFEEHINGLEKLHINLAGGKMIIFGAGPIGIMLGMLAKKLYSIDQVDFVELSEYRRSFLDSIGVSDNTYKPNEIEERINEFEGSYQYVVTACSAIQTHSLGISLLSNGGSINFFGGLPKPSKAVPIITNDIHYKELTLTGSHGSTPSQHAKAIDLINEEKDFFEKLITHRFKLDDINSAFDLASSGEGIKIVIKP